MTLHEQAGTYCTRLSPCSAVYPPVYCAVFRVDLAAQRPLGPKSHNSPTAWPCALVRVHTGRAMARPLSSQQVRAGRSSFGADSADSAARASVDSGEPGTGALSMRAACVSLKKRHVLNVTPPGRRPCPLPGADAPPNAGPLTAPGGAPERGGRACRRRRLVPTCPRGRPFTWPGSLCYWARPPPIMIELTEHRSGTTTWAALVVCAAVCSALNLQQPGRLTARTGV